jgi:PAS domain S-box-containing protein
MLAWSTDPTGFVEFLNQRWLEFAGMSAEQASGFGWSVAIHPDDAKGLIDYWQAALDSGTEVDVEARLRRFDGQYRWFLFRASPLRDESGKILKWYGTNVDIEDRKRADEELRRSEAFLAEGQRLSRTGTFAWRPDTTKSVWSEELYRIHEIEVGTPISADIAQTGVHPDDIPLVAALGCRHKLTFNSKAKHEKQCDTKSDESVLMDHSFLWLSYATGGWEAGLKALRRAAVSSAVDGLDTSQASAANGSNANVRMACHR